MRPRFVLPVLLALVASACASSAPRSPDQAAPIARELWEATKDADLAEVERLIRSCADPLVAFPHDDGRTFTAREMARARLEGRVGPPPDTQDKVALTLAEDMLKTAEEDWEQRCSRVPAPA